MRRKTTGTERTNIAQIDCERLLRACLRIIVEKIGDREFQGVVGGAIDRRREEGWEGRNWKFGYRIVLTKRVEKRVLEFGCECDNGQQDE